MPEGFAGLMAVVLVPLIWSGLIFAARRLQRGVVPDDGTEKRALAIMLAPVVTAILFVAWNRLVPAEETAAVPLQFEVYRLPAAVVASAAVPQTDWLGIAMLGLFALYCCGVAVAGARLVTARRRYRRLAASGTPHPEWSDVLLVDMAMSAFADHRGRVVLSQGFSASLDPAQVAMTIAHEREHLRRRDPRYYAMLAWIDVFFWFNPFLRAQTRNCRLAAELVCDAAALAAAPSMRKAYAATIVAALQHAAGDALACAPAAISTRNLGDHGMRIEEIMSPSPRRGKRLAVFAFAAVLALPVCAVQLSFAQSAAGKAPFMVLPLSGPITSNFGDDHPFLGKPRHHNGVDIKAAEGSPIVAPAAGRVVHTNTKEGNYGVVLEIDHGNGLVTRYAHLKSIEVKEGQQVEAGQLIARVGNTGISTGPHLCLQVMRDGKPINPAEVFDLKKS